MKRLISLTLGILFSLLLLIPIARLRQFMLEPDYVTRNKINNMVVRCDGSMKG